MSVVVELIHVLLQYISHFNRGRTSTCRRYHDKKLKLATPRLGWRLHWWNSQLEKRASAWPSKHQPKTARTGVFQFGNKCFQAKRSVAFWLTRRPGISGLFCKVTMNRKKNHLSSRVLPAPIYNISIARPKLQRASRTKNIASSMSTFLDSLS